MPSFNQVTIIGNLTRDVELRHIASGTSVTEITVAINDRVKKNDQWQDETSFIDVTLWGRTAELASQHLRKGSSCLIAGRLKQESWEQDGARRTKVKVIADKMLFMDSKPKHEQAVRYESVPQTPDDVPF